MFRPDPYKVNDISGEDIFGITMPGPDYLDCYQQSKLLLDALNKYAEECGFDDEWNFELSSFSLPIGNTGSGLGHTWITGSDGNYSIEADPWQSDFYWDDLNNPYMDSDWVTYYENPWL